MPHAAPDSWGINPFSRIQQWKEVVQNSLFGSTDAEKASEGDEHARPVDPKPAEQAAGSDTHEDGSQIVRKSLQALRRGILSQLDVVQHSSDDSSSRGDFVITLDMSGESDTSAEPNHTSADAQATASASRPVNFISYSPLVFACLRHGLNISEVEYRASFEENVFRVLKPATSKSGRCFFMTKDEKFILKSLVRAEVDFMLDMLCNYFEHVTKHPQTLLPRYCGLYVVNERGREVIISVEANAFSSECPVHERYDLKGSVVGRMTAKEDKMKDPDVILKDLDLTRQLPLGLANRSLLLLQLRSDCQFLESLEIVDYSLLLGVHHPNQEPRQARQSLEAELQDSLFIADRTERNSWSPETLANVPQDSQTDAGIAHPPMSHSSDDVAARDFEISSLRNVNVLDSGDFDSKITFNPGKVVVILVAVGDTKCAALCRQAVVAVETALETEEKLSGLEGVVLNLDTCTPHLVTSLRAFNVPSILCFNAGNEVERVIGAPSHRCLCEALTKLVVLKAGEKGNRKSWTAGPSTSVLRKDWNGVEGTEGDVFYFGIVDVLQPYTLKKQLEHSLKSLVQDKKKMTIVEPALYSQRFQAYISSILL